VVFYSYVNAHDKLQVVSREWSEEECEEVRRAIAENKRQETCAKEAVVA
jgi:hypothetical protein